ncbi:MAG: response regulator [Verrucomicrobiota bacterium]
MTSNVGKGSTFVVTLPADMRKTAEAATPTTALDRRPTATVLVIDDDPAVPDLIRRHLAKAGLRIEGAASGPEGLDRARRLRPDIIALDVIMPGMDGWAVLAALKSDPGLADIPVVMMSMLDNKEMGFSLGASDFLTKPIDWALLHQFLKRHTLPAGAKLILAVDDDPSMLELLERQLSASGWEVMPAANGRIALDKLALRTPSIILLDLTMPEMDGFAFLEEFQNRPDHTRIPVIVLTAKDLTAEDRERLNGSVQRVLAKGRYRQEDLVKEIQRLIRSRQSPGTAAASSSPPDS